jgi:hypothetical protein
MNSEVELKGYVEGKVPYFSRQKKIGREMRELCEDHHFAPFANMDDLNTGPRERNLGISHINMNGKRSTFKWFKWAFIITKVEHISILPLFPESKIIGQIKYNSS